MKVKFTFLLLFTALMSQAFIGCKKSNDGDSNPPVTPPPPVVPGISYFVSDASGSDGNSGLTINAALKTLSAANNKVTAGDTVFIMNGSYLNAGRTILNITKSGTANKYITFKNYPGHTPKFFISGNTYNAITINGSYIVIEGLDLQGDNANITFADATASFDRALAGQSNPEQGKYNTNCISIGGPRTESKFPHHVTIRNCKVHDFPGGGLSSIQADYTTFEGNTVYNNAWYMMYAGSGISILNPFNSDGADVNKYKNIVRNNIVYGNKTTIPWISIVPQRLSDGNGIIIDVNQYGYGLSAGAGGEYFGRTLVENNVSFNNGGSGIHAYRADHVDIVNNTAYGNGTVVGYADIYAGSSTDCKIMNNIMYARTGGKCNEKPSTGATVTYSYNIYFNGTVNLSGPFDRVLNPQFVNASLDGAVANFSVNSGSPAIDGGTQTLFAPKDIRGIARPKGANIDIGAYEVN